MNCEKRALGKEALEYCKDFFVQKNPLLGFAEKSLQLGFSLLLYFFLLCNVDFEVSRGCVSHPLFEGSCSCLGSCIA